ncbi:siderophore synthetase component-like protein [Oceanimonas sp. GK1]|uniref:IucA/IucC family protein n=1 Tax=Oceanimonas sp. (strain GK1 / IBRC-M 10197) TaxID=511062 RepID=UPI00024955A9|nr:IucA/IucC family protein [Oceanimonas sp. GK1]AEY02033.1 siderophore synthetase component-like protein [Oceanimonas sp. GK1]
MIPTLIYADRYRNEGTRSYSRHAAYTQVREPYRPNAGHRGFALPMFELPREQVQLYTANPSPALRQQYLPGDRVRFCLHPQVLEEKSADPYVRHTLAMGTRCRSLAVVPSSSSRTLYVQEEGLPHALKVHFPFQVSRYDRKMRDEVIAQAVNVSRELELGIEQLDERFAFLREVLGVVHRNLGSGQGRGENWGYLVREMTPYPERAGNRSLLPGFALYGQDFFNPAMPPLLFELIGDREPLSFVLQQILFPVIRHWVQAFRHFGYLLEPHGQNVLLEIDSDGNIPRIVHRDLSVGIDMRRRRDLGLGSDHLNGYNRMESNEFHSITYDKFMGSHFFDRIVAACTERYPSLVRADFTGPCREEFAHCFPDHARYLPPRVWYFSELRDRFNKPLYQDTGQRPEWRP